MSGATNGVTGKSTFQGGTTHVVKRAVKVQAHTMYGKTIEDLKFKGNLSNAALDRRRDNAAKKAALKAREIVQPRFIIKLVAGAWGEARDLVMYGKSVGDVYARLQKTGFGTYVKTENNLAVYRDFAVDGMFIHDVIPAGGVRRDGTYDFAGEGSKLVADNTPSSSTAK